MQESRQMIRRKKLVDDQRTAAQIREHYDLEVRLASTLRNANRDERRHLYSSLYDELFATLSHHPQLVRKDDVGAAETLFRQKFSLVRRYVNEDSVFLEVGPGDCSFCLRMAAIVKNVYAVDVSNEIVKSGKELPENFKLALSDGSSIPLPDASVTVAYSNQLMEHLHPEDAQEQLKEIHRVLKPGGSYICITPSRLAGPHDVSGYFDSDARGFHLKEYSTTELQDTFKSAGFRSLHTFAGGKGVYFRVPGLLARCVDAIVSVLPLRFRPQLANWLPVRAVLGAIVVGRA